MANKTVLIRTPVKYLSKLIKLGLNLKQNIYSKRTDTKEIKMTGGF